MMNLECVRLKGMVTKLLWLKRPGMTLKIDNLLLLKKEIVRILLPIACEHFCLSIQKKQKIAVPNNIALD